MLLENIGGYLSLWFLWGQEGYLFYVKRVIMLVINCRIFMKKIGKIVLQVIVGVGAALTLSAGRVMAFSVRDGAEAARAKDMPSELVGERGVFTNISNTILYIVGIISVIMLILGGIKYVLSGGDSKKVTDAKNTILYAIIGLVIAILAFAIVNFVLNAMGVQSANV